MWNRSIGLCPLDCQVSASKRLASYLHIIRDPQGMRVIYHSHHRQAA